uniref:Epoxide hydrolase 2, cytoplasmic n=1 Tax=Poecilia latipinna TaxID=48699 RepID=A0A3B3VUB4_9TELE
MFPARHLFTESVHKCVCLQMIPAFQAECAKQAEVRGLALPSDWCVSCLLEEVRKAMMDVQDIVLKTSAILANHWLDDSASGDDPARLLCLLGSNFNLQVGDIPLRETVKAAETAGMKAVLVDNLELKHCLLQAVGAESPPIACSPDQVSHGHVTIRIPALAAAGFRVLALDMKGYGESTAPPGGHTHKYIPETFSTSLFVSIPQVTLVGHDWGGALVWTMARYFPERIRAVASLNTPLFPPDPSKPPSEKLKALPAFDYQIYFQKPGVAEAELENDLERTFKIFFSSSREAVSRSRPGGLFVGLPQQIPRSSMLTEADLRYYVGQFRGSGFRGPLNWYRNNQANWKWMCSQPTGKIAMPALMVTAEKDPVLLPAMSHGMEDLVPNLSRGHIEDCGHWTQMDKPAETNNILISWLRETHGPAGGGPAGGELLAPKL